MFIILYCFMLVYSIFFFFFGLLTYWCFRCDFDNGWLVQKFNYISCCQVYTRWQHEQASHGLNIIEVIRPCLLRNMVTNILQTWLLQKIYNLIPWGISSIYNREFPRIPLTVELIIHLNYQSTYFLTRK